MFGFNKKMFIVVTGFIALSTVYPIECDSIEMCFNK